MQCLSCMEPWQAGDPTGGVSLVLMRETLVGLAEEGTLEGLSSVLLMLPTSGLLGWRQMERYLDAL